MGVGLAGLVAEFFEQAQGVLQVGAGLVEAADPGAGVTDSQVSVGLSLLVGVVLGGGQGDVVGGGEVVPVSLSFEEWHQRVRELPGVGVVAGGVEQMTSPSTGAVWVYEGATLGYRVLHLYFPRSGIIIALAANSAAGPGNDDLGTLALSVYQALQKAGAAQGS